MKKIITALILSLLINFPVYANKDSVKDGFISKHVKPVKNDFNIQDPEKKIILIYNHGQNENDSVKGCSWISMLRNHASLIDQEISGKKIMVYNLCAGKLRGDMSTKSDSNPKGKDWWYLKPQPKIYKGKHILDKRVEANLELIEKFVTLGVPRKQIFITGHSCGCLLYTSPSPRDRG